MSNTAPLPAPYVRHGIAFKSKVCMPTIRLYFRGGSVKPASRARIEDALVELGREDLIRPATAGDGDHRPSAA